jgi:hypothetical protein
MLKFLHKTSCYYVHFKRTDQNLSLNINSQIDNKWYNADEQLDRILIDLPGII